MAASGQHPPTRQVLVEVYLFRCQLDGMLAYRCVAGHLMASESPDAAAARIGGTAASREHPPLALHSTSWRHRGDGAIVLAYAVLPDPRPDLAAVSMVSFEIARGPRADQPSPGHVRREHVAAHAARHMALVARTDPAVRLVVAEDPALSRVLAALLPALAGQVPG